MHVKIDKDILAPYLIYSQPIPYNESITLSPVRMKDILDFNLYSQSITVRKNSRFGEKNIIKMTYLEFLVYAATHQDFCDRYEMPELSNYYHYLLALLSLVCPEHEVKYNKESGAIFINNFEISPPVLDDLRRIIIIQNDIDFNIDEFMNYDTERELEKARKKTENKDSVTIEDYIDSLCISLDLLEENVMNMTIRKFWRFIRRYTMHENYVILKSGECSGMVTFKEPIKHWIVSIDDDYDKYDSLKTDESKLKNKISKANS